MTRTSIVLALVLAAGSASLAAAATTLRGGGAEPLGATFEARAVGDPTVKPCPGLGPDGKKIEARYEGMLAIAGDERRPRLRLSLEILFDRSAGVGTAEGHWQLVDPPDPDIVGRGELVAVVTPVDPPDPDLALHGLLIGEVDPPDPDAPARKLLGNFAASLADGATFPHLKGAVGDPAGLDANAAVLLPAAPACER
jgi:hypothetical protein